MGLKVARKVARKVATTVSNVAKKNFATNLQKVAKQVAEKLQTHRTRDSMNPGRNEAGTQRHASDKLGVGGARLVPLTEDARPRV